MAEKPPPVLILGAGINGAALARELVLNGVPVCLVDTADVASGTTAYSSRLIHGGLRYLEYGEFDLVRESLEERTRWLRLAPQFVRPLELFIPVENRFGGLLASAKRFLRPKASSSGAKARGVLAIRAGLQMYDTFARDRTLPRHRVHRSGEPGVVQVNRSRYPWLCSYYDAQIVYPERFTWTLVDDARRITAEQDGLFELLTYHEASLQGKTAQLRPVGDTAAAKSFAPSLIVNATGAWVDHTLARLHIESPRLLGGTKGSHFITHNEPLQKMLAGRGVYAEASDGRPVFILPFPGGTLVGTTDLHYQGDPGDAVATQEELQYLIDAVNHVLPIPRLSLQDVDMHYSGVRPLPRVSSSSTGAITRRHWLEENHSAPMPMYSVVGGKLTTCRSLAESAAGTVLARLGLPRRADSQQRPLPGSDHYPADARALESEWRLLADRFTMPAAAVEAVWSLVGTRSRSILSEIERPSEVLNGTYVPCGFARWIIQHEHVHKLSDLVERRLMLLYHPHLTRRCLEQLTDLVVEAGLLPSGRAVQEVEQMIHRLQTHFGKRVY